MSKKKNKFKKSKKTQAPIVNNPVIQTDISASTPAVSASEMPIADKTVAKAEPARDEMKELDNKYLYVRKDVHKLLIVIGILIILFIGAYFLGIKTSVLTSVGEWVHQFGNFQL